MSITLPAFHRLLHIIVPQREGAIGGADLHVLDLAAAQQQDGTYRPLILTPRASRDYLQRLGEADLEILSPGLFRLDRYRRLPRERGIGSVGRLSPEKRIDLVLTAAYQVAPHRPDLHVLIVGGGEQRATLQALAQQLGLSRRVTFTGLLQDVTPALIAMDVLLQPSDTEGTPRSMLEAMAHRLPVVATDVGDVTELLDQGRCGELVPAGDAGLLARAVSRLLADPTRAQNLVQCARSRYENHYTIEIMRRRVEEAYHTAHRADIQGRQQ
jgi:glycosyltransferase involved in cell wall biosynthesis